MAFFSLKGLPPTTSSSSSTAARTVIVSIAKVVNPLGTVTTLTHQSPSETDDLDRFSYIEDGDEFIHENCDEALFRPVVAVFGSTSTVKSDDDDEQYRQQPTPIGQELIVPVIEKRIDDKRESEKRSAAAAAARQQQEASAAMKSEDATIRSVKKKGKRTEVATTTASTTADVEVRERKKSDSKQPKIVPDSMKDSKKGSGEKSAAKNTGPKQSNVKEDTIAQDTLKQSSKHDGAMQKLDHVETVVTVKLPKKLQRKLSKSDELTKEKTPPPPPPTPATMLPLSPEVDYESVTYPIKSVSQKKSANVEPKKRDKTMKGTAASKFDDEFAGKSQSKSQVQTTRKTSSADTTLVETMDVMPELEMEENTTGTIFEQFTAEKPSSRKQKNNNKNNPATQISKAEMSAILDEEFELMSRNFLENRNILYAKDETIVKVNEGPISELDLDDDLPPITQSLDILTLSTANVKLTKKQKKAHQQKLSELAAATAAAQAAAAMKDAVDFGNVIRSKSEESIDILVIDEPQEEKQQMSVPLAKQPQTLSKKEQKQLTIDALSYYIDMDATDLSEIECFENECSTIQDSIFTDHVLTPTVVVKKNDTKKKTTFAKMFSSMQTEDSNLEKPIAKPRSSTSREKEPSPSPPPPPPPATIPPVYFEILEEDAAFEETFEQPMVTSTEQNFDCMYYCEASGEYESLIDFQSPDQENAKAIDDSCAATNDKNIVFSMLQPDDDDDEYEQPSAVAYDCPDSDYKSLEQEIDEIYLSLELPSKPFCTKDNETNSSDDAEEDMSQLEKYQQGKNERRVVSSGTKMTKYKQEDDEELQPLIALSVSQEEDKRAITATPSPPLHTSSHHLTTTTGGGRGDQAEPLSSSSSSEETTVRKDDLPDSSGSSSDPSLPATGVQQQPENNQMISDVVGNKPTQLLAPTNAGNKKKSKKKRR